MQPKEISACVQSEEIRDREIRDRPRFQNTDKNPELISVYQIIVVCP
jgi:hypothetical protein